MLRGGTKPCPSMLSPKKASFTQSHANGATPIIASQPFDGAPKEISLHAETLSVSDIRLKFSKKLLQEKLGADSGFNAIPVKKRNTVVGYIVHDQAVPEAADSGEQVSAKDFRFNLSEYLDTSSLRIRLSAYGKPLGVSFVSADVLNDVIPKSQPTPEPIPGNDAMASLGEEREEEEASQPPQDITISPQAIPGSMNLRAVRGFEGGSPQYAQGRQEPEMPEAPTGMLGKYCPFFWSMPQPWS